jgi:hypothetical protein
VPRSFYSLPSPKGLSTSFIPVPEYDVHGFVCRYANVFSVVKVGKDIPHANAILFQAIQEQIQWSPDFCSSIKNRMDLRICSIQQPHWQKLLINMLQPLGNDPPGHGWIDDFLNPKCVCCTHWVHESGIFLL